MSRWLEKNAQWRGKGFFTGHLYDLGNCPTAIYDSQTAQKVFGEIWQLPDFEQLIRKIDHYEGTNDSPPEYVRELILVTTADNQTFSCWVYLSAQSVEHLPIISHGDYRRWLDF